MAKKEEPPAPPPAPAWPINASPEPAQVKWDSHGLQISAANSSLIQILHDYSVATGSKIEGVNSDERIYGSYGPGSARDVLTQLLTGTGYNIVMMGDLGEGAPREVVLSRQSADTAPRPPAARPAPDQSDDESIDNQVDDQQVPQQPIIQPQVMQPNMPPGNQPIRTPQQIMEEMQRREQQMLQQQQQQQNPQ